MIEIKDINGNIILTVLVTPECERVEELMKSDYVQLSWNSNLCEELPVGAYIEHNGERFSLLEPYKPEQKDELEFVYNPQFQSSIMAWSKKPFFFYNYNIDGTMLSKEPDWTLTDNPANFMSAICDAIKQETGEEWAYTVDASLAASASLLFQTTDIYSSLSSIANAFETEWWADKENNILHLEKAEKGDTVLLEVGVNVKTPSVTNNKNGYYTRFYAFGSTRNISQDYAGANVNNIVNKRLTLDPVKYPNGYKDIRDDLQEGEIFTKVLIFDDIYPSYKLAISDVRARLMYRLDSDGKKVQVGTDEDGNAIYDQYSIWYFQVPDYTFDKNDIIVGKTLSVNFKSGALQGREFELIYHEKAETVSSKDGTTFQVEAGDFEICFIEESTFIIPSMTGIIPSDGDEVILFNIQMPDEYTQSAYKELEVALDKEMLRLQSDLNNYQFNSNPIAFNESNPNLTIGQKVKYVNGSYSYETRVIRLVTKLDYPIEQTITIGSEQIKGNTQQLKEEVVSANKDINLLAVFNDMTQSIQQSYNRTQQMILEGFASIKNIWQLKTDESGNTYAFSAFDVVTQKGVTMYADGGALNLPNIYAGLPIDNQTLKWIETTNSDGTVTRLLGINPDIFDETYFSIDDNGHVTLLPDNVGLNESELAAYLNDKNYATQSWVYSLQYAKASDLTALQGTVNDFLSGSDTDTIINKWKELETFLSGLSESDNLATILGAKADKATTLAGYGITDAYTSAKVDSLLSDYQPLISSSNKIDYSLISGVPTSLKNPYVLKFGAKTYDGSAERTILASDFGALTAHQTIYKLTFQAGAFSAVTFIANNADKTVNIPTTTSHISEGTNLYFTDARAISALTSTLTNYVTIAGAQTVTGEKNFTGGLKVNGSPIVYDAANKYWKLEGDLLVTGGISMYSSDTEFTPSTIMDAVAVDGVTISKENGVLKVVGGTADAVAWENITGKPTFATVATSGSYKDLSNKPTALSAFTNDVGYLTEHQDLSGYQPLITSSNKLAYSLISGTPTIPTTLKNPYALTINGTSYDGSAAKTVTISAATLGALTEVTASMIADALGYTPYSSENPSGYITSAALSGYATQTWVTNKGYTTNTGTVTKVSMTVPTGFAVTGSGFTTSGTLALAFASGYSLPTTAKQTNWDTAYGWGDHASAGYLTTHQTIYALTVNRNGVKVGTYTPNSAAKTIDILVPTKVSELTNDSSYATISDVDTRISDLINGAPEAYDTLKEIADVLEGNIDSIGDIITTLGTKADKTIKISAGTGLTGGGTLEANRTLSLSTSGVTAGTYRSVTVDAYGRVTAGTNPTTLSGYGITDAYTKTEVTNTLKSYVTLAGAQTVTGEKNFTGGLKVNGSPLYYDATEGYWKLEGNLLVTGGITMYGTDADDFPSLIDSLPIASTSALGIAQFSSTYFTVSNGLVTIKDGSVGLNEDELNTLLDAKGYLTAHQTIYNLTMQAGAFSAVTFDPNGAAKTVNIPTTTAHISESGNLYFTNARAQAAVTGGASTIVTSNLTASRALVSNSSGKVAVSSVTSTELGYLSGVTSAVQTQINAKLATSTFNTEIANYVKKAGDTMSGELTIKTASSTQANLIDASGNYKVMLRADGSNFFILTTDKGDTSGTWNSLRPFHINLSTGLLQAENGIKVGTYIYPTANNAVPNGSSTYRWSNTYSVLGNFSGQVTLGVADGTAPLKVTSTTMVSNLNADMLDGKHLSDIIYNEKLAYGQYNRLFSFRLTNGEKGNIVFRVTEASNNGFSTALYHILWGYTATLTDEKVIGIHCVYSSGNSDRRTSVSVVRRTTSLDGSTTIVGAFDIFYNATAGAMHGNCEILHYTSNVNFLTRTPTLATADDIANAAYTSAGNYLRSGTFVGSLSGNATSASKSTYSDYVRITDTEPTSITSYYVPFVNGTTAGTNYYLRGNDGFVYRTQEGTADAVGNSILILGNSVASGTAGNKRGSVRIYGNSTSYTELGAKAVTSANSLNLPGGSGTLVYHTSDTQVGSANLPVYVDSTGKATACGTTLDVGVKYLTYNSTKDLGLQGTLQSYINGTYGDEIDEWNTPYGNYTQNDTKMDFGTTLRLRYKSGYYHDLWFDANKTSIVYRRIVNNVSKGWTTLLDTNNFTTHLNDTYVKKAGDTMTGRLTVPYLTISDTAASAHIQFSRATYNYITAPANGIIAIMPNNGGLSSATGYYFDGTKLYAGTTNSKALGSSTLRWSNVYSVLGDFSGQITSSVATGTAPFVVASTTEVANLHSATATKLHTARTIWGQSFNGSANVSGALNGVTTITGVSSSSLLIHSSGSQSIGLAYNGDGTKAVVLDSSSFRPYSTANGLLNLGTSSARWKGIYGQTLDLSGNATVSGTLGVTGATTLGSTLSVTGAATLKSTLSVDNTITVPRSSSKASSMGFATSYADCWTYKVADSDGTTVKSYIIPHYGYSIGWGQYTHTDGTTKTSVGSFISDYHGLNLHTFGAIRFSYGGDDSYQVNASITNSGLTVNKAVNVGTTLSVGTNLTVAGTSTLTGAVTAKSTLTTTGSILPSSNGGASLGATATRWAEGYFTNSVYVGAANSSSMSGDTNTLIGSGAIEIVGNTPYIDFHHNKSTLDYTSRIIEGLSGQLTVTGQLRVGLNYSTSTSYKFHVEGDGYFNGWLRTDKCGWLDQTYGGGWYMTDSTWVRVYGSKNVYQSTGQIRTDGYLVTNSGITVGATSPNNGTYKLHVTGSGYISSDLLTGGGITMYSQRSLKNIVDERGLSLEQLSIIKPTRYTWKDKRDDRLHIGGIADDIEQVLPEVVYKTSDGVLTMDYGNAAFAIASSLIQPVIAHENEIASLKRKVRELEEEVKRLKSA